MKGLRKQIANVLGEYHFRLGGHAGWMLCTCETAAFIRRLLGATRIDYHAEVERLKPSRAGERPTSLQSQIFCGESEEAVSDHSAVFLGIYVAATNLAQKRQQVVGENGDYYVTLEQLQVLIEQIEAALRP